MIRLEHVTKRYGSGFEAVSDLSLEIGDGEVFGFLGPNGAGKTTTMRMITGLIQPTQGRILVGGYDIACQPVEAKRLIGFIPDRPYLYEKLSAVEFMRFVAGLYRMKRRDAARRTAELLERFDLTDWGTQLIESYSHGMKQRLVFASALLPRPRVLVVDEPMVGLDPKGRRLIKQIFGELCRDEGMTVFLSTHTLETAEEVCHRVAILYRGKIVLQGDLDSVRNATGAQAQRLEEVFLELTAQREAELAAAQRLAAADEAGEVHP